MKTPDFRREIKVARAIKELSADPSFLEGYIRGLRRHYHGENFGTAEEHAQWMALADEQGDAQRTARGKGYRAGYAGQSTKDLGDISSTLNKNPGP